MRVALAQINPIVGDIDANADKIIVCVNRAAEAGADLIVTPELAVFGYPPRDLVLRKDLVERNVAAVRRIAERCTRVTAVVGFVRPDPSGQGRGVLNAAAVCRDGRVEATYSKMLLPTYDVFDEWRYFNPGDEPLVLEFSSPKGPCKGGVTICEDLWNNRQFEGRRVYGVDPIRRTVQAGAELLINLSASPYRESIHEDRQGLFSKQVKEHRTPLIYVNQVGGNDHLIFDGASMVLDADGRLIARAKAFAEDFLVVDFDARNSRLEPYPQGAGEVCAALALGIRDYVQKCGFREAVIGLSGGIDSAVTAALAVEALGAGNVHGIAMPSRFSSAHSVDDAQQLAANLGISFRVIPIEDPHMAFERTLQPVFEGWPRNVTEENVQSRIRGNILMSLSNKFGWLLLTTGNKSELAVGFCTLYGDMCGGLAVLSDVPKTMVYQLAADLNARAGRSPIPQRTIDKPPSAELRPDQLDEQSIPPYSVLDPILEQYIEQVRSPEEIIAAGFERSLVERVVKMVQCSEYKRKQAPVGLKVTSKAFGTGRRMPIAARYL